MIKKILEGKLMLYSETGMEGGYLSIQDKEFIKLSLPTFGISDNCKVWDKDDSTRQGLTSDTEVLVDDDWLVYPDPINNDPDYLISSLYCGEEHGDLDADSRLMDKYGFKIKYAEQRLDEEYGKDNWKIEEKLPHVILKDGTRLHFGGTPTTIPRRPYGIAQDGLARVTIHWNDNTVEYKKKSNELLIEQWDYKGLNMLKGEDILKVIDPVTKDIICQGQIDLIPLDIFSQTKEGHFTKINLKDNANCNWEKYFTENYYAELHRE